MDVLTLTIFVSLILTVAFVLGFIYQRRDRWSNPERDSLFPLESEQSRPAKPCKHI